MKNLRVQLLLSHLLPVALMVIVMAGGIYNFFRLSHAIDLILRNNYRSVIAAQNMKESLERQDSAATFYLAGQETKARSQYQQNWPKFQSAYNLEAHNITEPGEQQMANAIGRLFPVYRKDIEKLLYASPAMRSQAARSYYFSVLEPLFLRIKSHAQDVLNVNQSAILNADTRARHQAERASRNSILVTVGAFAVALVMVYWTLRASLTPLRSLAMQAEEIGRGHLNQRIALYRSDEIGTLADTFNKMSERLLEARRLGEERLHRAERMSDAALQSLYDPVLVTDSEGRIVYMNPAAEMLFGSNEQAVGGRVAQVIHEPMIAQSVANALTDGGKEPSRDEEYLTLTEGERSSTYRLRATPMHDNEGNLLGSVAVLDDITRLRELDRMKTEFISVASHELRTPVTSLLLSVQLLQEGAAGSLSEDQKQVVLAQSEDLKRLEKLMRDLLDVTRLEAGVAPPVLTSVPPSALVEAALQTVAGPAESAGVRLLAETTQSLPNVEADSGQIVRVLVNLLTNAIRHTPRGGKVTVSLNVHENLIDFGVEDTGSGIPQEYLARIFEPFVQVPGATRGGAGLGLSIAQGIVLGHGGKIAVTSNRNGSSFHFSLKISSKEDLNANDSRG